MNNYKSVKGISTVDIVISLGIITIFIAIIVATYTNLSLENVRIQRMQVATNTAIAIFEKIDKLYYSEVETGTINVNKTQETRKIFDIDIPKGYDVLLNIETQSLVKIINIEITYSVGNKEQNIAMKKIKEKETISTPNKPILINNYIPVKYILVARRVSTENQDGSTSYRTIYEKQLVETNEKDSEWYNYSNKIWALAKDAEDIIYAWIPRFAYHSTENNNVDIKFIYVNGKRFINNNGDLESLTQAYQIPIGFGENTGIWVPIDNIANNESSNLLNSNSKYGPISN